MATAGRAAPQRAGLRGGSGACFGIQVTDRLAVIGSAADPRAASLLLKRFRFHEVSSDSPVTIRITAATLDQRTWAADLTEPDAGTSGPETACKHWRVLRRAPGHIAIEFLRGATEHVDAALQAATHHLHIELMRCGLAPVHAASVSTRNGVYLIFGQSGQGKSTLAGCLAAAGAQLVSDDVTVLELRDGIARLAATVEQPHIAALVDTPRLMLECACSDRLRRRLRAALRKYPWGQKGDWNRQYKVWISMEARRLAEVPGDIARLLLIRDCPDSGCRFSPVEPAEVFRELVASNMSRQLLDEARFRYFHTLAALSRRVPCFCVQVRRGRPDDMMSLARFLGIAPGGGRRVQAALSYV